MPRGPGQDPEVSVLVFTAHPDEEAALNAMLAGAAAFLLKDVTASDLVVAIEAVAAGGTLIEPEVVEMGTDEPRNRGAAGPGREDREELRVGYARQVEPSKPYRGAAIFRLRRGSGPGGSRTRPRRLGRLRQRLLLRLKGARLLRRG